MTIASKLFFYQRSRADRTTEQPDAPELRPVWPSGRRLGGHPHTSFADLRRINSSPPLKSTSSIHRLQNSVVTNNEASRSKDIWDERLPARVMQARERLLIKLRSINLTGSRENQETTISRTRSDEVQFTKKSLDFYENAKCSGECCICLEKFLEEEKLTQLDCKHVFHSACLEKWVPIHSDCPYCRTPFVS